MKILKTIYDIRYTKYGLTLIELMITIVMVVILASVTVYVFRAVLLSWSVGEERAGVDISLDRGIERMVRDLREAANIDNKYSNEIRFTRGGHYIYYFYNATDPYPTDLTEASYELRKADLSGVTDSDLTTGIFTDGSGRIIITDVIPATAEPNPTELSKGANDLVTIILNVQRDDEALTSKTQVKARNL